MWQSVKELLRSPRHNFHPRFRARLAACPHPLEYPDIREAKSRRYLHVLDRTDVS
jgi:hypothetical protein